MADVLQQHEGRVVLPFVDRPELITFLMAASLHRAPEAAVQLEPPLRTTPLNRMQANLKARHL